MVILDVVHTLWNNLNQLAEYTQIADLSYIPEGQVLRVTGVAPNHVSMPASSIDIVLFKWARQMETRFPRGPMQQANAFSDIAPQD